MPKFDFDNFSHVNRVRCESPYGFNHPMHTWSMSDWYTATSGELGEAGNVIKKLNRVRDGINTKKNKGLNSDQLREKLASELADTFCYLDLMCQALGFSLPEIASRRFNEVSDEIGYMGKVPIPDAPESLLRKTRHRAAGRVTSRRFR